MLSIYGFIFPFCTYWQIFFCAYNFVLLFFIFCVYFVTMWNVIHTYIQYMYGYHVFWMHIKVCVYINISCALSQPASRWQYLIVLAADDDRGKATHLTGSKPRSKSGAVRKLVSADRWCRPSCKTKRSPSSSDTVVLPGAECAPCAWYHLWGGRLGCLAQRGWLRTQIRNGSEIISLPAVYWFEISSWYETLYPLQVRGTAAASIRGTCGRPWNVPSFSQRPLGAHILERKRESAREVLWRNGIPHEGVSLLDTKQTEQDRTGRTGSPMAGVEFYFYHTLRNTMPAFQTAT